MTRWPTKGRSPLQARQCDVAFRIENAIHLGTARLQQDSHTCLGSLSLLHGLGQLPGYDLLDGLGLRFGENAFLLQEVVHARSEILLSQIHTSTLAYCRIRLLWITATTSASSDCNR